LLGIAGFVILDLLDPRQVPLRLQLVTRSSVEGIAVTGLCQRSGRDQSPMNGGVEFLPVVDSGPVGISGEKAAGVVVCTIVPAWKSECGAQKSCKTQ
jgi:hypothetical protein